MHWKPLRLQMKTKSVMDKIGWALLEAVHGAVVTGTSLKFPPGHPPG